MITPSNILLMTETFTDCHTHSPTPGSLIKFLSFLLTQSTQTFVFVCTGRNVYYRKYYCRRPPKC